MATLRDLRNKIRSIRNTKKITRTMEMIATAKSVVCQKRIEAVQLFGNKLGELLRDLGGVQGSYPLLRQPRSRARRRCSSSLPIVVYVAATMLTS